MKIVRKSRWSSVNAKRAKKFVNMRAAKERIRMERALAVPDEPHGEAPELPRLRSSGFVITVRCLDDDKRASFTTLRGPWGLTVSPTLAGRRVACRLANYEPVQPCRSAAVVLPA